MKQFEIVKIQKGDVSADCPKCKQYNAMLFKYHPTRGDIVECRNCGIEAIMLIEGEDIEICLNCDEPAKEGEAYCSYECSEEAFDTSREGDYHAMVANSDIYPRV